MTHNHAGGSHGRRTRVDSKDSLGPRQSHAGTPNTAQPSYWTSFNASCHTCHATAAINPETGVYFPFSVPTGALTPQYYATVTDKGKTNQYYLGEGFVPLDFMWPIAFHAQ